MVKRNDNLCIVTIRELMDYKEPPKKNLGIPEYQRPYKWSPHVNVNIRMYNFDDVQCTVIPSVAYGFVTGMNLQLC